MTKEELSGIFITKLNHIQLCYASLVFWSRNDSLQLFNQYYSELGDESKIFPDILSFLNNKESFDVALDELYQSAYISAAKELFSLTKTYCFITQQTDLLKSQKWYAFWWILRNCWSHNNSFNFNEAEKKMLPVTWLDAKIDISMNGKKLKHGDCSYQNIFELIRAAGIFVENELA